MEKNYKEALIIFAKNPVPGKVKTRLAADLGDDKAFEIYLKLLYRSYANTKNLSCDKFLYLSDSKDDVLFDENFIQYLQKGNDLGEKMKNAFKEILSLDYEKIVIIGTDCADLDENILNEAFEKLNEFDFVLGPANDGGYYLLGQKSSADELFEDIEWSTEKVLQQTIDKIDVRDKSYFLLKVLTDIDNISDLENSTDY
ncbi:MAG: TIGR04282 family arsenosugar biosynthesis glycosyltransferase [Ignavibacteria bacterium]